MLICKKCNKKFKQNAIVNNKKLVLSNRRRYCLTCSPYMGRNNRKLEKPNILKPCRVCNKPSKRQTSRLCASCETKIRKIRVKKAALKLLGGSCNYCGWDKEISLQFHHTDPTVKEFQISKIANRKWELVKNELKKCIILCANCHIAHHSNRDNKLLEEVFKYRGRLLDL